MADKKDVLLVPNAALRWQPTREQIAPDVRMPTPTQGKETLAHRPEASNQGFVWVKSDDGYVALSSRFKPA